MGLPDFLLLGAPKAGTTALHVALAAHPQLHLSAVKEPKFFLTDGPPPTGGGPGDAQTYRGYVWQRPEYEALFEGAQGRLCGESTTLYLRDPAAHLRIRALVPQAKLIAVLRDPVDRAHSNWAHLRSAGLEPESDFLHACTREDDRAEAGWGPFWRYLGLGRYGEQLQHLYSVFPREQVLLLMYRDLRERPLETLDQVCAFLGVQTGLVSEVPAENVTAHVERTPLNDLLHRVTSSGLRRVLPDRVHGAAVRMLQREQRTRTALQPGERRLLIPNFAEDVALLEELTGRSYAHWRDPRNGSARRQLDLPARIGTAYQSIDRPLPVTG